jgi:SAM-dependent methyltransferase
VKRGNRRRWTKDCALGQMGPERGTTVSGRVHALPRTVPAPAGKPAPAETATFQPLARSLARGALEWTTELADMVGQMFDEMALTWNEQSSAWRDDPVHDALDRGGPFPTGPCLDVGAGTGMLSAVLRPRFPAVVTVDLSMQMLRRAPRDTHTAPVQADAAHLPFADSSVACVLLCDALLFAAETARVLRADGVVLWINRLGPDGPLHVPAADVAEALGPDWTAVHADAGWGDWAALRRATATPRSPALRTS